MTNRVMDAKNLGVLLSVMTLLVVACGESSDQAATDIVVVGAVYTDFHGDSRCEDYPEDGGSRPEELSGVALVFSDGTGTVLGQATTETLEWSQLDDGCRFLAHYDVVLPAVPVYQVDFDPPPPEGSFFGAEELTTQKISLEDLRGAGFEWNFDAPPTFEHGDPPCAFDETACLAAELVLVITLNDDDPSAVLTATAGIEANSWIQDGVLGSIEDPKAAAMIFDTDLSELPTVAPRFELGTRGDADLLDVRIFDVRHGELNSEDEPAEVFQLDGAGQEVIHLPAGPYIVVIQVPGPQPLAEFLFGIRVP